MAHSTVLDIPEHEFESLIALHKALSEYKEKKREMFKILGVSASESRKILYWKKEDPFVKVTYKEQTKPL